MPSETSAVNAAYIEARMKQFKLVDMREQYQELIRVASEQSMTYEDFLIKFNLWADLNLWITMKIS